jgi:hypothetical protein
MANLEREDPDGEGAAEVRGRLRELARMKARKQRELKPRRGRLRRGQTPKLRNPCGSQQTALEGRRWSAGDGHSGWVAPAALSSGQVTPNSAITTSS